LKSKYSTSGSSASNALQACPTFESASFVALTAVCAYASCIAGSTILEKTFRPIFASVLKASVAGGRFSFVTSGPGNTTDDSSDTRLNSRVVELPLPKLKSSVNGCFLPLGRLGVEIFLTGVEVFRVVAIGDCGRSTLFIVTCGGGLGECLGMRAFKLNCISISEGGSNVGSGGSANLRFFIVCFGKTIVEALTVSNTHSSSSFSGGTSRLLHYQP